MRTIRWLLVGLSLAAAARAGEPPHRFTVGKRAGVWWFLAPDGTPFTSRGVDCVGPGPDAAAYRADRPEYALAARPGDTLAAWARRTGDRLAAWGFNTAGGWSDQRFTRGGGRPYTVVLHLGVQVGAPWSDLWDPEVIRKTNELAVALTAPTRGDPELLGYFLDNEFGWADQWILDVALGWGPGQPGRRRLVETLRATYGGNFKRFLADFTTTARDWPGLLTATATGARPGRGHRAVDAWTFAVARQYDEVCARAVRKADPGALVLGDRFRQYYPQAVARAARGVLDAVSTNYEATTTDGWVSPCYFRSLADLSGLPVVVGEFYATARQNRSGNRNHGGEFTLVDTQAQRAAAAVAQANAFAAMPWVIGWHWFQWNDEPTFGRGDGEDYDMGLVDIADRPYDELVAAFTAFNARADEEHAEAAIADPPPPDPYVVPRRADLVADGRLGEWDKTRAVPRALLATDAPLVPFGDVFLGWEPENLWLGVRAYDFTPPSPVASDAAVPATWVDLHRLEVSVNGTRVVLAGTGLTARGPKDEEGQPVLYAVPPAGGRPSAALASHLDRWHYVWEAAIPAAALGRDALRGGDRFALAVTIRNRGDFEVMRLVSRVVLEGEPGPAAAVAPEWPGEIRNDDGLPPPRRPRRRFWSEPGPGVTGAPPFLPPPAGPPGFGGLTGGNAAGSRAGLTVRTPEAATGQPRPLRPGALKPAAEAGPPSADGGSSDGSGVGDGGPHPEKPPTPETTSPVPETKVVPGNPPPDNPGQGRGGSATPAGN